MPDCVTGVLARDNDCYFVPVYLLRLGFLSFSLLLVLPPFVCILFSIQATGPFLHIGALAAATALSWIVAGQVARAEKTSMFTFAACEVTAPSTCIKLVKI